MSAPSILYPRRYHTSLSPALQGGVSSGTERRRMNWFAEALSCLCIVRGGHGGGDMRLYCKRNIIGKGGDRKLMYCTVLYCINS